MREAEKDRLKERLRERERAIPGALPQQVCQVVASMRVRGDSLPRTPSDPLKGVVVI